MTEEAPDDCLSCAVGYSGAVRGPRVALRMLAPGATGSFELVVSRRALPRNLSAVAARGLLVIRGFGVLNEGLAVRVVRAVLGEVREA